MIYKTSAYLTGYTLIFAWRQNVFNKKDKMYYNKNAHKERFTHAYQSIVWPIFILPMTVELFIIFERKMNKYLE
jgi:hypothetical protein